MNFFKSLAVLHFSIFSMTTLVSMQSPFERLPVNMLELIASELPLKDLLSFSQLNKKTNKVARKIMSKKNFSDSLPQNDQELEDFLVLYKDSKWHQAFDSDKIKKGSYSLLLLTLFVHSFNKIGNELTSKGLSTHWMMQLLNDYVEVVQGDHKKILGDTLVNLIKKLCTAQMLTDLTHVCESMPKISCNFALVNYLIENLIKLEAHVTAQEDTHFLKHVEKEIFLFTCYAIKIKTKGATEIFQRQAVTYLVKLIEMGHQDSITYAKKCLKKWQKAKRACLKEFATTLKMALCKVVVKV